MADSRIPAAEKLPEKNVQVFLQSMKIEMNLPNLTPETQKEKIRESVKLHLQTKADRMELRRQIEDGGAQEIFKPGSLEHKTILEELKNQDEPQMVVNVEDATPKEQESILKKIQESSTLTKAKYIGVAVIGGIAAKWVWDHTIGFVWDRSVGNKEHPGFLRKAAGWLAAIGGGVLGAHLLWHSENPGDKYGIDKAQLTEAKRLYRLGQGNPEALAKIREKIFHIKAGEKSADYDAFLKDMQEENSKEVIDGVTYAKPHSALQNYEDGLRAGIDEIRLFIQRNETLIQAAALGAGGFALAKGLISIRDIVKAGKSTAETSIAIGRALVGFPMRHPLFSFFIVGGGILAMKSDLLSLGNTRLAAGWGDLSSALERGKPLFRGTVTDEIKKAFGGLQEHGVNLVAMGTDLTAWLQKQTTDLFTQMPNAVGRVIAPTPQEIVARRNAEAMTYFKLKLETGLHNALSKGDPKAQEYQDAIDALQAYKKIFLEQLKNPSEKNEGKLEAFDKAKLALAVVGVTLEIKDGVVHWIENGKELGVFGVDPNLRDKDQIKKKSLKMRLGEQGDMEYVVERVEDELRTILGEGAESWPGQITDNRLAVVVIGNMAFWAHSGHTADFFAAPVTQFESLFLNEDDGKDEKAINYAKAAGQGVLLSVSATAAGWLARMGSIGGWQFPAKHLRQNASLPEKMLRMLKPFVNGYANPFTAPAKLTGKLAELVVDGGNIKNGLLYGRDINSILAQSQLRLSWVHTIEHTQDLRALQNVAREMGVEAAGDLKTLRETLKHRIQEHHLKDLKTVIFRDHRGQKNTYDLLVEASSKRGSMVQAAEWVRDATETLRNPRMMYHKVIAPIGGFFNRTMVMPVANTLVAPNTEIKITPIEGTPTNGKPAVGAANEGVRAPESQKASAPEVAEPAPKANSTTPRSAEVKVTPSSAKAATQTTESAVKETEALAKEAAHGRGGLRLISKVAVPVMVVDGVYQAITGENKVDQIKGALLAGTAIPVVGWVGGAAVILDDTVVKWIVGDSMSSAYGKLQAEKERSVKIPGFPTLAVGGEEAWGLAIMPLAPSIADYAHISLAYDKARAVFTEKGLTPEKLQSLGISIPKFETGKADGTKAKISDTKALSKMLGYAAELINKDYNNGSGAFTDDRFLAINAGYAELNQGQDRLPAYYKGPTGDSASHPLEASERRWDGFAARQERFDSLKDETKTVFDEYSRILRATDKLATRDHDLATFLLNRNVEQLGKLYQAQKDFEAGVPGSKSAAQLLKENSLEAKKFGDSYGSTQVVNALLLTTENFEAKFEKLQGMFEQMRVPNSKEKGMKLMFYNTTTHEEEEVKNMKQFGLTPRSETLVDTTTALRTDLSKAMYEGKGNTLQAGKKFMEGILATEQDTPRATLVKLKAFVETGRMAASTLRIEREPFWNGRVRSVDKGLGNDRPSETSLFYTWEKTLKNWAELSFPDPVQAREHGALIQTACMLLPTELSSYLKAKYEGAQMNSKKTESK